MKIQPACKLEKRDNSRCIGVWGIVYTARDRYPIIYTKELQSFTTIITIDGLEFPWAERTILGMLFHGFGL
jgi:hypothetical protein